MMGDLQNGVAEVDDDIQKVIDRLLAPTPPETHIERLPPPDWQQLLGDNTEGHNDHFFKSSPLTTAPEEGLKSADDDDDLASLSATDATAQGAASSSQLICDPIRGILTGETDTAQCDINGWLNPWNWSPADSSYVCDPFGMGRYGEPTAERIVAASLAYLATKIVGSTLPKDTQEALISSPPSSLAEARSLMSLLQSQPRRRGRPRKNPCLLAQPQERRPRGRPRKKPLETSNPPEHRQQKMHRLSRLRSLRREPLKAEQTCEESSSPQIPFTADNAA